MINLFAIAVVLSACGILALLLLLTRLPADSRNARLPGFAMVALGVGLAPFSFSRAQHGVCAPGLATSHTLTASLCAAIHVSPTGLRTVRVTVTGQPLLVEIADTWQARARGLMFRRYLAPRHGMIFIYSSDQREAFWMKNTWMPLDMLFFSSQGVLQDVRRNVQPCKADPCPLVWPAHNYRYVIELPAGDAWRMGFRPGSRLVPAPVRIS